MSKFKFASIMLTLAFATFTYAQDSEVEALRNEYMALKIEKAADRKTGEDKLGKVLDILAKFNAKSKKAQNKAKTEFAELVSLAAAALPFDQETACAESIEMVVNESPALKKVYEDTLKTIQDSCRKQFLETVVTERTCYREAAKLEKKGKALEPPDKCVAKPVFTYEGCVGVKIDEE